MKKLLVAVLTVLLCVGLLACAPAQQEAAPAVSESAESSASASEAAEASQPAADGEGKTFKIGFAQKTMDNPFFLALANAIQEEGEKRGWTVSVLDAKNSLETEMANMETFVSQGMDLIFLNTIDSEGAIPEVQAATAAGIPVIELDSGISPDAGVVTTVFSDNRGNGRKVGLYAATCYDEGETISSVILSGDKGNPGGEDRRMGLFCGIIEARAGLTEEEAWVEAEKFNQELTDNGKAFHEAANFEVLGQGWAHWTADDGLPAMEDLLVANPNINCVLGENDNMLIGGMEALRAVDKLEQVQMFAACDGQKEALALIQQGTSYKASGENNPNKVAELGYQIAEEILVEGKDPTSYPEESHTDAVAITPENVDELYDPNAIF